MQSVLSMVPKFMKQLLALFLVGSLLFIAAHYMQAPVQSIDNTVSPEIPVEVSPAEQAVPEKVVLGVSIHTIEGLRVLFDRAEELATKQQLSGADGSVVLVLHGPEVAFFSIRNYDKYKDIVDQAARLDAFDVVDVKICRTMMGVRGVERDDLPSFIEQVPFGPGEVERLQQEGYVSL
jgi:intracellular sulfur oxidation DsrE/DsrF family protein